MTEDKKQTSERERTMVKQTREHKSLQRLLTMQSLDDAFLQRSSQLHNRYLIALQLIHYFYSGMFRGSVLRG